MLALLLITFIAITYAQAPIGSVIGLSAADKQDIVDRHNYLRTQRCVADLAWSDEIATVCIYRLVFFAFLILRLQTDWAGQCKFLHSNGTERRIRSRTS
jgi:hypothetical protein